MRGETHRIVIASEEYRAVDRAEVFDEKGFALAPDARVTPRDFRLRVKARKIDFWKNIRVRV